MWINIILFFAWFATSTTANTPPVKLDLQMDVALLIDWHEYSSLVKKVEEFVASLTVAEDKVRVAAWVVGRETFPVFNLTGNKQHIDQIFATYQKPTNEPYIIVKNGLTSANEAFATAGRVNVSKVIYFFFDKQQIHDLPTANITWKSLRADGVKLIICAFHSLDETQRSLINALEPSYLCKDHPNSTDASATIKELQQQFSRQACGDTNSTCVFKSIGGTCVELPWPTDIPIDRIQCMKLPEVKTCDTTKCTDFCESFFESKDKSCSGKCDMQNRSRAKQAAPWLEEFVKMCKKDLNCGQCATEKTPGDSVSGKPAPGNGTSKGNGKEAADDSNKKEPVSNCPGKVPIWAIIVIVVLSVLLLIAVTVAILVSKRRKVQMVASTAAMVLKPAGSAGSIKDGHRGKPVESKGARSVVGDDRKADQDDQNIGVSLKREASGKSSTEDRGKPVKSKGARSVVGDDRKAEKDDQNIGVSLKREATEKSAAEEPIKNAGSIKSSSVKSGDRVKSAKLSKVGKMADEVKMLKKV